MSASGNQAAEPSKDTDEKKPDPPRLKIRIRLPPRKRLTNDILDPVKEEQQDTNNNPSKKAPEQTDKKTPSENLTTAAVHCCNCPGKGLCHETNSNPLMLTVVPLALPTTTNYLKLTAMKILPAEADSYTSTDKLFEDVSGSTLRKNLPITTGVQGNNTTIYPAKEGLCEEANSTTPRKALPVLVEKLTEEVNDSTLSKNLPITTGLQGNNTTIYAAKEGMCEEANSTTRRKALPVLVEELTEEFKDCTLSKNLPISIGVQENNMTIHPAEEGLGEEASNTPRKALSVPVKELHEEFKYSTLSTLSKNLPITIAVQGNNASICPARKSLCEEANNNSLRKALPVPPVKELHEEFNGSTLSKNLPITTAERGKDASIYPPERGQCEEANNTTPTKALQVPVEELAEEPIDDTPSKNLTTTAEQVEENDSPKKRLLYDATSNAPNAPSKVVPEEAKDNILSPKKRLLYDATSNVPSKVVPEEAKDNIFSPKKRLLYDATSNTFRKVVPEEAKDNIFTPKKRLLYDAPSNAPSKVVPEEAKDNNRSRNLRTTAVKSEEMFEQVCNRIPTKKLSSKAKRNAPGNRPTIRANKNIRLKKLRTSVVQITSTSQNTSGMKLYTSQNTSAMKLSPSVGKAVERSSNASNMMAVKEYKEFEEEVKRTVYLDNFSHQATEAVIKTALNQFGAVRKVSFLVNYTVPYNIPQSALVEMETEKDAMSVVNMLHEFPFMMAGMPRPVWAKRATAEMFSDRPRRPGNKMNFRWMGPMDPGYESFKKLKLMSRRHEAENLALIKHEMEAEQSLAKQQQENLNCAHQKLESIDSVISSGLVGQMLRIYGLNFNEVF